MELFLDMWVDRWASFRFSFSKASLLMAASHFLSTICWCTAKMHRLMLIMCTKLTVNGGFGVGEEKDFDTENGFVKVFRGFSVNKVCLYSAVQKD